MQGRKFPKKEIIITSFFREFITLLGLLIWALPVLHFFVMIFFFFCLQKLIDPLNEEADENSDPKGKSINNPFEENPAQVPLKAQEVQSTKQVKTDQRVTVSLNETNTTSKQIPISPDERNVTVTAIKSEGKRHSGNLNTDF